MNKHNKLSLRLAGNSDSADFSCQQYMYKGE